jgi:hypothetical protein
LSTEKQKEASRKWRQKNKERVAETNRLWMLNNLDKVKEARKRYYRNDPIAQMQRTILNRHMWRNRLIDALGGCCEKCGFQDRRALEIDHKDGSGKHERKTSSSCSNTGFFKNNALDPTVRERLSCLCANCHRIKTYENDDLSPQRKHPRLLINPDGTPWEGF